MQKITTFLTFRERAEEAAKFYVSIFKPSKIVKTTRYGAAGPGAKGSVMTVQFKLAGQEFIALNGGDPFTFTMGVSLTVNCKTQKEIDTYTRKLTANGGEQLPFTGFAAIPILLGGVALLTTGLVMRRRTADDS